MGVRVTARPEWAHRTPHIVRTDPPPAGAPPPRSGPGSRFAGPRPQATAAPPRVLWRRREDLAYPLQVDAPVPAGRGALLPAG